MTTAFSDWQAFGKASEQIATDREFLEMMSASHANGRMTTRELLVEVQLG